MKKSNAVGILVLALVVWSGFQLNPLEEKIKLGLDLRGGVHLLLRVAVEKLPPGSDPKDAVNRTIEILRRRVDGLGVNEPLIQAEGKNHIVVQLPGFQDPARARDLIGKTAVLQFMLVENPDRIRKYIGDTEVPLPKGLVRRPHRDSSQSDLILRSEVLMGGESLTKAFADVDEMFQPQVSFELGPEGAKAFARLTRIHVGRRLAIVLDNTIYSAPVIQSPITAGRGVITGLDSLEEAKDLALILQAGSLPTDVEIEDQLVVGPSLGADSVRMGTLAGMVGLLAVVLCMVFYYRISGMIASVGLLLNLVFLLAVLAGLDATLTLPGIGGIVLTIGFATDANVLIFERIREELAEGRTVRASIDRGYGRAMTAIIDSQVTTLITAVVLFQFGTGPIRGFAVTLFWGVLINLFTAVVVTRAIFDVRKGVKVLSI